MGLSRVLQDHRVVIAVGSGGVGKTTTAAALGVWAAMQGKKVLTLTIDPAHRLANSLGLYEMVQQEQRIPTRLFEAHGLRCTGSLSAMMLDTKRTFDELVARHAPSPEARDRILRNRIYEYVSTSLPGTSEYMAMEKLHAVRQSGDWDLIILDTPPTSNALDFLDAPERLVGLVDSPAIRWFVDAFESTGKLSLNLVGKSAAFLLRGLAKFTGAAFLDVVAEFVTELNELFGGFRERAQAISAALRSPEVAFVIVTSTNALTMDEAMFFHRRLQRAGMATGAFVLNFVHPMRPEPSASRSELLAEAATRLPDHVDAERALGRLRRALDDARIDAVADRIQCDRLRSNARGTPCVEVPAFDEDVHDLSALARVAAYLMGGEEEHAE